MKIKINFFVLLVLYLWLMLLSCSSGGPGGFYLKRAYLPFIEDVSVTSPVSIDEHVLATVRFSALLKPDILESIGKGPFPQSGFIPIAVDPVTVPGSVYIKPWVDEPLVRGEVVDTIVFDLGTFDPGIYQLVVQSASTKELGGIDALYNAGNVPGDITPSNPDAVFLDPIEFTVLPAAQP